MTHQEQKIIHAAIAWWSEKEPIGMTMEEHISNATINTATEGERLLALSAADYLKNLFELSKEKK
jgi:hypothetical protein